MNSGYFFCGIGGSGMSALAMILRKKGHAVFGSDRSRDKGESPAKFRQIEREGIEIFPQDGSGITDAVDCLVVSSAVEDTIPDVRRAKELGVPIRRRADLLAELFNASRGIGIAGTSGKTTVTGMAAHILQECGLEPTVMNGGQIINFMEKGLAGNAVVGQGDVFIAETDESDGSIALYEPAIAVLNNVTLDHKPLDELRPLFAAFLNRAREAAIANLDDKEAAAIAGALPQVIGFGIENESARFQAAMLIPRPDGISFTVSDNHARESVKVDLQVPGRHNVYNALAAIAAAVLAGVSLAQCAEKLRTFKGIKRRFEIVGTANGIIVIDDFAHNPDKIEATLSTLKTDEGRIIAFFQPHGYGPTKMLKDGIVRAFTGNLGKEDILLMPEIYYAGGTAQKTISSRDIIEAVTRAGHHAHFIKDRAAVPAFIRQQARQGDRIIVMGARDDTLADFAREILAMLKKKAA